MKYHLHVPTLHEFTLDAACDDVVKHGAYSNMPYALYLRCIYTFNRKHLPGMTVMKIYRDVLHQRDIRLSYSGHVADDPVACRILVDHVVLDKSDDNSNFWEIFRHMMYNSVHSVDDVVECIHRFASRCIAADMYDWMLYIMSCDLSDFHESCQAIRDVFINYGVRIRPDDDEQCRVQTAVERGIIDTIRDAADSGYQFSSYDIRTAIRFGDRDVITIVTDPKHCNLLSLAQHGVDTFISVDNIDVSMCELLLTRGIIKQGIKYTLFGTRSLDVVMWFISHDLVDVDTTLRDIIANAVSHGGVYDDIMRYVIEQVHWVVPVDTLFNIYDVEHFSVLSYLISHGADVNAVTNHYEHVVSKTPLLLRYWLDKGFKPRYDGRGILMSCIERNVDVPGMVVMMEMTPHIDLTEDGGSLLRHACYHRRAGIVEMLINRGVDVDDAGGDDNATPLHIACLRRYLDIVQLLLSHGADQNVTDRWGRSPRDMMDEHYDSDDETLNTFDEIDGALSNCGYAVYKADDAGSQDGYDVYDY